MDTPSIYTDEYFNKTYNCVDDDTQATYGVFLRHDSICAIQLALDFLAENCPGVKITRHFVEGAPVPSESPLFSYQAPLKQLVRLETKLLQRVGFSCISAFNAFSSCMECKDIPFMDMHARHAAGDDMVEFCAYGASVGSKSAQMQGAKGFVGSSLTHTAHFYGAKTGMGTMPHVLIGYAGSTLKAVQLFMEKNPTDTFITALIDYYGREIDDMLEVAAWWKSAEAVEITKGKTLGVRLDTHGGRFVQGLDYDSSVGIVGHWVHKEGKWPIVRSIMGNKAFELCDDAVRDGVAKTLFGTGVSVANVVYVRNNLNAHGHQDVKIVCSSGFGLKKCRIMNDARAPIDMVGTGSFLPETMSESYATADCYAYGDKFGPKVGREGVFREAYRATH